MTDAKEITDITEITDKPKRGRPFTLTDGKRVTLTLDAQTIERGTALGAGNLSRGVRLALANSGTDETAKAQETI